MHLNPPTAVELNTHDKVQNYVLNSTSSEGRNGNSQQETQAIIT